MLGAVDRSVSLTHYIVTKIEGGSGPEAAGNDALASVVTQIQAIDNRAEMPSDFPGSMGTMAVKRESGGVTSDAKSTAKSVTFSGTSTSSDIVVASAKAYLSAINRMIGYEQQNALLQGRKR